MAHGERSHQCPRDKNWDCHKCLASLGVGHVEEGGGHSHEEDTDSAAVGTASDFVLAEKEAVMQATDMGTPLAWHPCSFGAGD